MTPVCAALDLQLFRRNGCLQATVLTCSQRACYRSTERELGFWEQKSIFPGVKDFACVSVFLRDPETGCMAMGNPVLWSDRPRCACRGLVAQVSVLGEIDDFPLGNDQNRFETRGIRVCSDVVSTGRLWLVALGECLVAYYIFTLS